MIFIFLLIVLYSSNVVVSQPLLFPHGWYQSKNLRPRDAIMLNMMAQSAIEYGGNTLADFDTLDAVRKLVPRPSNLPRDRLEDDEELDREPITTADSPEGLVLPKDGEAKAKEAAKNATSSKLKRESSPFRRVELKLNRKRAVTKQDEEEVDASKESTAPSKSSSTSASNPFEEIATRGPPRDYMYMRQLRNRHRKNRKRNRRRYRKHGFLSRDDIIKAKPSEEAPSVQLTNRDKEKAEFEQVDLRQKTYERESKATEEVRKEMLEKQNNPKKDDSEEILKNPIQLRQEAEEMERRGGIGPEGLKIRRLPNNPYRDVDIRKPTVIELPIPPENEE